MIKSNLLKISKQKAVQENWDGVKSWNYKLKQLNEQKSVIYAEITGNHGKETSGNIEQIYYILDGEGEFLSGGNLLSVVSGDVVTIPANTEYSYRSINDVVLKIISFAELWNN